MSSESSSTATKWVVGCLAAAFLGVVLCAGGAFLAFRATFQTARNAAQQAMQAAQEADRQAAEAARQAESEMAAQLAESQFGLAWVPPAAGAGPDVVFPEHVGAWKRTSQDDTAEIAELALTRPGQHAVYESGISGIDVYVYEVAPEEHAALFQAAENAIDTGGHTSQSRSAVDDGTVHRMTFSFAPPDRHGLMWWCKGWLLLFIADDPQVDLSSFRTEYATLIQGTPGTGEPVPATPGAPGETRPGGERPSEASADQPEAAGEPAPMPER
jgi:hypothetical protein